MDILQVNQYISGKPTIQTISLQSLNVIKSDVILSSDVISIK